MRNLLRPAHGQKPFRGQRDLKRDLYYLQKYKNTKKHYTQIKDALNAEIQKINPFRGQRALGRNPYYSNYLCFLSANSTNILKCNFNSLGNF